MKVSRSERKERFKGKRLNTLLNSNKKVEK